MPHLEAITNVLSKRGAAKRKRILTPMLADDPAGKI